MKLSEGESAVFSFLAIVGAIWAYIELNEWFWAWLFGS